MGDHLEKGLLAVFKTVLGQLMCRKPCQNEFLYLGSVALNSVIASQ